MIKYKINDELLFAMKNVMTYQKYYLEKKEFGGAKIITDNAVTVRKAAYQFLFDNFDLFVRKTEISNMVMVIMQGLLKIYF